MIEQLTPILLAVGLLLVVALASLIALLASLLVLALYRRRLRRAMLAQGGGLDALQAGPGSGQSPSPTAAVAVPTQAVEQCRRRVREGPWRLAARQALAGLAYVLVMSAAVGPAFPEQSSPLRVTLFAWGYAWPLLLALLLSCPLGVRGRLALLAAYFLPLALFSLFALGEQPSVASPADLAALSVAITPPAVARAWLLANAVPTLVLLVFLNRWLRAVGPLLLALTTVITAGLVVLGLSLFSVSGVELVVALAVATGVVVPLLLPTIALLGALSFATLGWLLLRRVRRAYLSKRVNDRSLAADALWLYFAGVHAMFYAMAGLAWALAPLLAYAAYKSVSAALSSRQPPAAASAQGLTYLRVFSLGRRSDRLFDALSLHWRHVGSLQLISGPDLAHSTLQPHQLLDFLAGRLARHFVADADSLAEALRQLDRLPDRDGLYRINNFLCHADSWQTVLARLVGSGDRVLLDLRSFSPANTGCAHELRYLVNHVPLARCVLLVDDETEREFLHTTLREAWPDRKSASPNRQLDPGAVPLLDFAPGPAAVPRLLRRLCAAG